MDIYKYRDDVLKKLKEMTDEEFVNVLKEAGVNCELTRNGTYRLGNQKKTDFNSYSIDKNNYMIKSGKYNKNLTSFSKQKTIKSEKGSMRKIKYNYSAKNNNFNNWSEVAA